MAYNEDKKSTELDELTALDSDDLIIVGDYSDSGRAKKITKTNFGTTIDDIMPDSSTTVKGFVKMSTAPASATEPIAVGTNDARVPTTGENDALVGTAGTPSSTNKYVTNDDTGETGTSKVVRTKSTGKLDNSIIANLSTSGIATYDLTTASGAQNIAHGLGVIPTKVNLTGILINGGLTEQSIGGLTSSGNRSMVICYDEGGGSSTTDVLYSSTTYGIAFSNASANDPYGGATAQKGVITVDATNITITWTKSDSPSGTATILWEAQY